MLLSKDFAKNQLKSIEDIDADTDLSTDTRLDALEVSVDTTTTGLKDRATALETSVDTASTGLLDRATAIEDAIAATWTLNGHIYKVTASLTLASADVTLSAAQLLTSILEVTTGHATNAIIAPAATGRAFIVINNDAVNNVLIKKAAGTAVTIPPSTSACVYYNGTQYVAYSDNALLTGAKIGTPTEYVILAAAAQTNAAPTVTFPDLGDAADTVLLNDTTAVMTLKTLRAIRGIHDTDYADAISNGDMVNAISLDENQVLVESAITGNILHTTGSGTCKNILTGYLKAAITGAAGDSGTDIIALATRAYCGDVVDEATAAQQVYGIQTFARHAGTGTCLAMSALSAKLQIKPGTFTSTNSINAGHFHIEDVGEVGTSVTSNNYDGVFIEFYPGVAGVDRGLYISNESDSFITSGIQLVGNYNTGFTYGSLATPITLPANPGSVILGTCVNILHSAGAGDCTNILAGYSKATIDGDGDSDTQIVGYASRAYVTANADAGEVYGLQTFASHTGTGTCLAMSAMSAKLLIKPGTFTSTNSINAGHFHIEDVGEVGTSVTSNNFDGVFIEIYPGVTGMDRALYISNESTSAIDTGIALVGAYNTGISYGTLSAPIVLATNPGAVVLGTCVNILHSAGAGDCENILSSYFKAAISGAAGDSGTQLVGVAARAYVGSAEGDASAAADVYGVQTFAKHAGTGTVLAMSGLSAKLQIAPGTFTATNSINAGHFHLEDVGETGVSVTSSHFDCVMMEVYPGVSGLCSVQKMAVETTETVGAWFDLDGGLHVTNLFDISAVSDCVVLGAGGMDSTIGTDAEDGYITVKIGALQYDIPIWLHA